MEDQSGSMSPGDQDLERRLEAYAGARLSPSDASTTETRRAVMAAAHRQAALVEADASAAAAGDSSTARSDHPKRSFWQVWRRPVAAVLGGCLLLGVVAGSAFAARPGGPLYATRLWVEMDNLPSDLVARAQGEVQRLQSRIDEAQEASSAGDSAGTEAALVAYSSIVVEAAIGSEGDATARSTIEGSVQAHVTVLTALIVSAPPTARAAAQDALTQSTRTLQDLKSPGGSVDGPSAGYETHRAGDAPQGPKADRPEVSEAPANAVGCAPGVEPSENAVATTDRGAGACDPTPTAPGTNSQNSQSGQGGPSKAPSPTPRPADKSTPPGQAADHAKQSAVPHVTGGGSPQERPVAPSPKPTPDPTHCPPMKQASNDHKP